MLFAADPTSARHLARYDAWANRRFAVCFTASGGSQQPSEPIRLVAHAAMSELVWLRRIEGTQPTSQRSDFWPDVNAEACRTLVEEAAEALGAFTEALTPDGFDREAVYRNSQGTEYRTPVRDVLTHLFLHSHYHRGQAATALRALGHAPPMTDYIVFARESASG